MSVELPKDAEGREIPLDTVALYDESGNVHSIRRFIYTTDFDLSDKWMNSWYVVADDYKTAKPEQMYLTKPDSLKKVLEDLDRSADELKTSYSRTTFCAWFNSKDNSCQNCPAKYSSAITCESKMFLDIASRLRKLMGED